MMAALLLRFNCLSVFLCLLTLITKNQNKIPAEPKTVTTDPTSNMATDGVLEVRFVGLFVRIFDGWPDGRIVGRLIGILDGWPDG